MNQIKKIVYLCGIILWFNSLLAAQQWTVVKSESRFNISGMAQISATDTEKRFIVVHDNKDKPEEFRKNPKKDKLERAGILTVGARGTRPRYERLKWIDENSFEEDLPVDLESIAAVPEKPLHYIALVGNPKEQKDWGRVFYLILDEDRKEVRVLKSFRVPTEKLTGDFEGFEAKKIGGKVYAFWTERGRNQLPATLFWGELNLEEGIIKSLGETAVKTPYPETRSDLPESEMRSISEIKIDSSGAVFISSAFDAGDAGPFASALFLIGAFEDCQNNLIFRPSPSPLKLFEASNYKIEAFDLVGGKNGGVIFATDDEDFGAAVYFNWF